jgi:CRP-like cAMP-binding protein
MVVATMLHAQNGQHLINQGQVEGTFYVFRRGQAEVVLDEDNGNVLDTITAGDGVGELGLLLGTKRTVTVRCTGPCEVFAITRESYETAVALLPEAARGGDLVLIMKQFWKLATGKGGTGADYVDYKVYLAISTRISKTLSRAADVEEYNEDEVLATAQDDWTTDCKRWDIKVTDTMDMPMFMCVFVAPSRLMPRIDMHEFVAITGVV